MKSGVAELTACLASLTAMSERAKRLVPEYDQKIRKNPNSSTEDIARLENSISFPELRSLDRLCSDALSRWLPDYPQLAKEWFVNETVGVGSPEDVVGELQHKRTKLIFAIDLYRSLQNDDGMSANSDFPAPYKKLGEPMQRFLSDSANSCDVYEKNVLIMTRFLEGNREYPGSIPQ